MAKFNGLKTLSLDELRELRDQVHIAIKQAKRAARVLPPKFANPEDPNQTWAGRGLRPRWAKRMSKATLEECRV